MPEQEIPVYFQLHLARSENKITFKNVNVVPMHMLSSEPTLAFRIVGDRDKSVLTTFTERHYCMCMLKHRFEEGRCVEREKETDRRRREREKTYDQKPAQ